MKPLTLAPEVEKDIRKPLKSHFELTITTFKRESELNQSKLVHQSLTDIRKESENLSDNRNVSPV